MSEPVPGPSAQLQCPSAIPQLPSAPSKNLQKKPRKPRAKKADKANANNPQYPGTKPNLHEMQCPPILGPPGPNDMSTQTNPEDINPPQKIRKQKGPLRASDKNIVINIYNYVKETWPIDVPPFKSDIAKKAAQVTGCSMATVYKVLKEFKTEGRVVSPPPRKPKSRKTEHYDDKTLDAIRQKVHGFLAINELPTLDKILTAVNNDDSLPNYSRTNLWRVLKEKLKFKFIKRSRKNNAQDRDRVLDIGGRNGHTLTHTHAPVNPTRDLVWEANKLGPFGPIMMTNPPNIPPSWEDTNSS